eukprot:1157553-Pelagomonas_calceolata.AAC.4
MIGGSSWHVCNEWLSKGVSDAAAATAAAAAAFTLNCCCQGCLGTPGAQSRHLVCANLFTRPHRLQAGKASGSQAGKVRGTHTHTT